MSDVKFDCTAEEMQRLLDCIERNKDDKGALMPVMHEAQNIFGYLPLEIETLIAEKLNVPLAEVYGVATFYSQFSLQPKGKHQVSVCLGTACYVKGSDKILAAVEKKLKIKCGECSADGLFSIDSCRCVGACGLAPVMIVDGEVYGKLEPDDVEAILDKHLNTDNGREA